MKFSPKAAPGRCSVGVTAGIMGMEWVKTDPFYGLKVECGRCFDKEIQDLGIRVKG